MAPGCPSPTNSPPSGVQKEAPEIGNIIKRRTRRYACQPERLQRLQVIGWTATTAGLSGEMIRDMMVSCVEARFGSPRAPHRVQWLSDNGSIYAAAKTIDIALALNLDPCFTPVESPESNGIAEAFVKMFKRDYVRVNPIPNAEAALAAIPFWMDDHNDVHPHSRLGYRAPREYIRVMSQPAACPV
jgi:putative transposase